MEPAPDTLWIVAAIFVLAGLVKGVVGLGLPTVAMGLLGLVMPPAQAAALLVVPSLVTNVWQLVAGPALGPLVARLWTMMAGICAGTWLGTAWIGIGSLPGATGALGLALMAYAGIGLWNVRFPDPGRREWWLSPVVGAVTGLVTAATGVFVLPAVPYLQVIGLDREELVQALGLSFTVSTLALAAGLVGGGAPAGALAVSSGLAVVPAVGGMILGQALRSRVSPATFRRWFFVGLLALGAHLAIGGLR